MSNLKWAKTRRKLTSVRVANNKGLCIASNAFNKWPHFFGSKCTVQTNTKTSTTKTLTSSSLFNQCYHSYHHPYNYSCLHYPFSHHLLLHHHSHSLTNKNCVIPAQSKQVKRCISSSKKPLVESQRKLSSRVVSCQLCPIYIFLQLCSTTKHMQMVVKCHTKEGWHVKHWWWTPLLSGLTEFVHFCQRLFQKWRQALLNSHHQMSAEWQKLLPTYKTYKNLKTL